MELPVLNVEGIKNSLANKSAADSWHDFHTDISGIADIIISKKEDYMRGLPAFTPIDARNALGSFNDESEALNSVIASYDNSVGEPFGSFLLGKSNSQNGIIPGQSGGQLATGYNIVTTNGSQYNVKAKVVAFGSKRDAGGKTLVEAKELIETLGIANGSALVIDATAVSILDILKSGNYEGERPTIYYAYVPEVVNDPAGKTPVDSAVFKGTKGVNLVPCLSNSPPGFNYNYSYKNSFTGNDLRDNRKNPYEKFFTRYNFQLSELQIQQKGKKLEYTTNLVISSNDPANGKNTENIIDSKKKNNIPFLKSILINTIKLLGVGNKKPVLDPKAVFLFNTKFQQKRSGDWLQVLACLLLRSRPLKQNNGTGPARENIQNDITDVYFVTHDRIALAYALLCGVECIYTHANTKAAYIFQLASPQQEEDRANFLLAKKRKRVHDLRDDLMNSNGNSDYTRKYVNLGAKMILYNDYRRDNIIALCDGQINDLCNDARYNSIFVDNYSEEVQPGVFLLKFDAGLFSEFTSHLFCLCLNYNFLLLNFPDIQKQYDDIATKVAILNSDDQV